MHSHDGVNFNFPDLNADGAHPIIDLTPHLRINPREDGTNTTDLEVGQMYPSSNIIEIEDKILVYYTVREDTHYESFAGSKSGFYVAELRVDGFAGLRTAGGETGELLTRKLTIPAAARGLLINADVEGSLKVQVLDPLGELLGESTLFTGDEVNHRLEWEDVHFVDFAGDEVQLRFEIEDGELFSFSFTSTRVELSVEHSDYEGLSDTERIDQAVADAAAMGAQLVFGARTYYYEGQKVIDHDIDWLGSQGEIFSEDETLIRISGRWTFSIPGSPLGPARVRGIAIDGDRSFTGDMIRVSSRFTIDLTTDPLFAEWGAIEFDNCHFMGALHEQGSDAGRVLALRDERGSVRFVNGSISNAHSTAPIEEDGGWRNWPSIRGFDATGFEGTLEMRNVDIFDIGHEVAYASGQKVWESPPAGRLHPGGQDIDAWQLSGSQGQGTTLMDDVRFRSISGSYMKVSQHGGTLDLRNLDLHVRANEPTGGRLIRLQSHGDGHQRNGTMDQVRFRIDRSQDLTHLGDGSALQMLMSFSGNLPEESFHVSNTIVEIGKDQENPVYLSGQAIFGYHRTTAAKHGLVIENTRVDVPGGIRYFFRNSTSAVNSEARARRSMAEVTFKDNEDIDNVRYFYYVYPHEFSCWDREYTYNKIHLEGNNSFLDRDGMLQEVVPEVGAPGIWYRFPCPVEGSEVLEKFIFEFTLDGIPTNIGFEEESVALPDRVQLDQNYPNPFNPSTQIRFSLPEHQHVTLKIFDITGRFIATLVDGPLPAGVHTKRFHADNLSSGLYLYRLQAGEKTLMRRMMFVK